MKRNVKTNTVPLSKQINIERKINIERAPATLRTSGTCGANLQIARSNRSDRLRKYKHIKINVKTPATNENSNESQFRKHVRRFTRSRMRGSPSECAAIARHITSKGAQPRPRSGRRSADAEREDVRDAAPGAVGEAGGAPARVHVPRPQLARAETGSGGGGGRFDGRAREGGRSGPGHLGAGCAAAAGCGARRGPGAARGRAGAKPGGRPKLRERAARRPDQH